MREKLAVPTVTAGWHQKPDIIYKRRFAPQNKYNLYSPVGYGYVYRYVAEIKQHQPGVVHLF